jgi:hypothetical protein
MFDDDRILDALREELHGNGHALGNETSDMPMAASVGGCRIGAVLGRGGQGVVYEGIQESTNRKVAVKVLAPGRPGSSSDVMRFEREAELVSRLRHPGIVTLFDSGRDEYGRPYVVMDYVRGVPIDRYVDERSPSLAETMRLFGCLCDAVQHAHQRGILHRDLKPSNILVDEEGNPRILDFGLAKSLGRRESRSISVSGELVGTVAFMSPEQVRGVPDGVDARTDVYALGVLFYRLVTGAFPYPVDGPMLETIRHIEETEPTPPRRHRRGTREDTGTAERLPADVRTILAKSLAKDPIRRYQSAGDLRDDVRRFLDGLPILAKADDTWYLARRHLWRHRGKVVLVAASLLLITGATVGWVRTERRLAHEQAARITALLESPWDGSEADEVRRLYAAFLDRLKYGPTTPEERDLFLSNAFGFELMTRPFQGRKAKWTARVLMTSRVELHESGIWGYATFSPKVQGITLGEPIRVPLPNREGSPRVFRLRRAVEEALGEVASHQEVVASMDVEVVLCPPEEITMETLTGAASQVRLPETVYWRGNFSTSGKFILLEEPLADDPPAVMDDVSAERVERAFSIHGLRIGPWGFQLQQDAYAGEIPLSGRLQLVHPTTGDVLVELPNYLLMKGRKPRTASVLIHPPETALEQAREGQLTELIVRILPERGISSLYPEIKFYYGRPVERAVPALYVHEQPEGKETRFISAAGDGEP